MQRPARRLRPLATWMVAVAVLATAVPATAQWRWRDATGRVTASDRPPPNEIPEKDILQRPSSARARAAAAPAASAASVAASAAPRIVDKDLEAKRRATEQEAQAKAKADEQRIAAQRAENCRRARNHLSTLESGQRLARVNDKGEREILDDAARAAEMQRAREVISSDCR